jgi:hypothetical protein
MDKPEMVFLLSSAYSGATLLSLLMNQHPDISSDGEAFPFMRGMDIQCSCGRRQIDCPYYRSVAGDMIRPDTNAYDESLFWYMPRYSRIHHLSRAFEGFWLNHAVHRIRNRLAALPPLRAIEDEFLRQHLAFCSRSLERRRARVYFDGTKSMRRAELFAERGLTAKMVQLIRDGRAFCNSYRKNNKLDASCLPKASQVWKQHIRKVDALHRRLPSLEILVVRYGDLCASPESEVRRIWEFMGLGFDPAFLEYDKADMHVTGNRMRMTYDGVIREDTSWRDQLAPNHTAQLDTLLKPELERFQF